MSRFNCEHQLHYCLPSPEAVVCMCVCCVCVHMSVYVVTTRTQRVRGHLLEYDISLRSTILSLCDAAFFSDGTTSYSSHTLRNQLEMCWLSRLDLPSPHTVLVPPSSCAAVHTQCSGIEDVYFLHGLVCHSQSHQRMACQSVSVSLWGGSTLPW